MSFSRSIKSVIFSVKVTTTTGGSPFLSFTSTFFLRGSNSFRRYNQTNF